MRLAARLLLGALMLLPWSLSRGADECEAAVDMADSYNAVNRLSECDYSDKGINGWLSGLGRDNSKATAETASSAAAVSSVPAAHAAASPHSAAPVWLRMTVKSAADYSQQRFEWLRQAAQYCQPGRARLKEESVQSQEAGLQIRLRVQCMPR